jgi:hypothetical protein
MQPRKSEMAGKSKVELLLNAKTFLNRFTPPSWIIFCQTQWLYVDASTTNKTFLAIR